MRKFFTPRLVFQASSVAGAGAAGCALYDYLSEKNMAKMDETVRWDVDWDRYTQVPRERALEVAEWFVAPDWDILEERKTFDLQHGVRNREILMVRHGQYESGGSLTALGREQAALTGVRLKQVLAGKHVRRIFHSNLPRARETAEIIQQQFSPNIIQLRESALLAEAIPAEPDPPCAECPEYVPAEGRRLEQGFRTFFARPPEKPENQLTNGPPHPISVDIIVGHGNCIRFFLCRAMQLDPRFWLRMSVFNCGISWVDLDADGVVSVRAVGDTGHLPPHQITYN